MLDTGGDDGTVKSGIADSGGFTLDTRDSTLEDSNKSESGFDDSNSFVLDTEDDDNQSIVNDAPLDLNFSGSVIFAENLPVGHQLGQFSAYDPDDHHIEFLFADGDGNWTWTNGLIAYYPMDGSGDDFSGNGYHSVSYGTPTWTSGVVGNALDGNVSRYFEDSHDSNMTLGRVAGRHLSISLWYKKETSSTDWMSFVARMGINSGASDYVPCYAGWSP